MPSRPVPLLTLGILLGCATTQGPARKPEVAMCNGGSVVGPPTLRLLTRFEYDNTVRDLLGDETRPAQGFAAENRTGYFANDAASHQPSPLLVAQMADVAEAVAARAAEVCRPGPATACRDGLDGLIDRLGTGAYRRPSTDDERRALAVLYHRGLAEGGAEEGARRVIAAVLQSPQFLYRVEIPPTSDSPWASPWEMAGRLSHFLWSSAPDRALLDEAARGGLASRAQVEAAAVRLLDDPRARPSVREFFAHWLGLELMGASAKSRKAFPDWDPVLVDDWRESVLHFAEYVTFDTSGTPAVLFGSPRLFLSARLAALYGTTFQAGVEDRPEQRVGLLTQPALMAMLAYPDQSSPVARGVFVRERVLCQPLPPPPPDMAVNVPPPDPRATTRERFEDHRLDVGCARCHRLIDPVGLGFEAYDGLGRFRSDEHGLPLDTSGRLDAVDDPALVGDFDGAHALSARLGRSREVAACVARQVFTFAMARPPMAEDACTLETLGEAFRTGGLRNLLVAVATSDPFRRRGRPIEETTP